MLLLFILISRDRKGGMVEEEEKVQKRPKKNVG